MSLVPSTGTTTAVSTLKTKVSRLPYVYPNYLALNKVVKWDRTTGFFEIDSWFWIDTLNAPNIDYELPAESGSIPTFMVMNGYLPAGANNADFNYLAQQLLVGSTNVYFRSTQTDQLVNYRITGRIDPTLPSPTTTQLTYNSLGPDKALNYVQPAGGYVFYPCVTANIPEDYNPAFPIIVEWNYEGTITPNPTVPLFPQNWEWFWIKSPTGIPLLPPYPINPPAISSKQFIALPGGAGTANPTPYNATPSNQDRIDSISGLQPGDTIVLGGLAYYQGAGFVGMMRCSRFSYNTLYD